MDRSKSSFKSEGKLLFIYSEPVGEFQAASSDEVVAPSTSSNEVEEFHTASSNEVEEFQTASSNEVEEFQAASSNEVEELQTDLIQ